MKKLLIVDDEAKIREVIKEYAEFSRYEAHEAADGMSAVGMVKLNDYDLIIMDIMMPKLDGFSSVKEIHKIKKIPVIMLSARGEEYDKLFGFELGIDDYVVKPFSPKELMARIRVIVKRNNKQQDDKSYVIDGLVIDPVAHNISVDGKKIEMANKEFELLLYLVENRGKAMTRESIISNIWGYECDSDTRTLDTHMKLLRRDLGPYEDLITTIRGVGYRFEKKED